MAAACSGKVNPIPQAANNLCVQLSMETGTFSLVDDPKVSLKELISKGGYGFVDPAITDQNFKLSIEGKRDVVLYADLGDYLSSDQIIRCMEKDGYLPATLDDALAMGAMVPERQRENPILFLGTTWRDTEGHPRIPVLDVLQGGRGLDLPWFRSGWGNDFRFAAVRELN
jgi:hypothetical protein